MQSPKSAPVLTRQAVLFAIAWSIATALTTTSCKTQKTTKELQYDRQVIATSEMIKTSDVRDNSITDITIIDFDTLSQRHLDERSGPDPLELLESNQKIKRLTLIHRQNDIQTTKSDSTIIQTKDSLKSHEIVQNKSSPDKASQAISTTTIIIILSIIILSTILVIKFFLR